MNNHLYRKIAFFPILTVLFMANNSCEPLATSFREVEDAIIYTKEQKILPPQPDSTLKVMTWNIRFGIGRQPWFGDACGDNTVFRKDEVIPGLEKIVTRINQVKPDILFLSLIHI